MSLSVCCFSAFNLYYNFILVILAFISYLFPHLLSTNHKCTQPCYFPIAAQTAAQSWRRDETLRQGVVGLRSPQSSS
jgi:hypothetical protein